MLGWSRRIFISYRRAEAGDLVGRLHDRLVDRGRHRVFLDSGMPGGTPYHDAIADELRRCEALLAIIGPGWLDARDAEGRRRLDDPDDLLRLEIETALKRGVQVVPVLINGAVMPEKFDLPDSLRGLRGRQALPLRSESFHSDVGLILAAVKTGKPVPAVVAGILLLVAAASMTLTVSTLTANIPLRVADAVTAAALAALGIWLSLDQWRRPVAAGIVLGLGPFVLLKIWRSAVVRGVPVWESAVPLLSVSAAVALVIVLLAIDPAAGLRYERPQGDATRTVVPLGALACVAFTAVGSSLPVSDADLGTLRLSDPLVLLSAAVLALLVTCSRGTLRGGILVGWAGGTMAVLANTVWLRSYSGFALPPVTHVHLLLSILTVTVLATVALLAFREKPRTAVR